MREESTGQQHSQLGLALQGIRVTREHEAGRIRGALKATVSSGSGQAASPVCCQGVVSHHCQGRALSVRPAATSWPCPLVFILLGQVWS